jgi:hypothetical protein
VPNVPRARKSFWPHPMDILGDVGQMEAHFGPLEVVLINSQDRCTVCDEHAIGLETFWAQPMELQGDVGQGKLVSVSLEIMLI